MSDLDAVLSGAARYHIECGDCLAILPTLDAGSVQCCVTSPPYWGLRDYGEPGQLGLESTPEEYVSKLVAVFREVRRVLHESGTVWLNLGDCYAGSQQTGGTGSETITGGKRNQRETMHGSGPRLPPNLKPKDLVGAPWRVAFALQADGWWLRSDIVWSKPNPMPESVCDRPTRSHEYLFLLTRSERYFYDADAIRERHADKAGPPSRFGAVGQASAALKVDPAGHARSRMVAPVPPAEGYHPAGRNRRSVWTINPQAFPAAHFATFPPALVLPCIRAGTSQRGCCPECRAPWERVVETSRAGGCCTTPQIDEIATTGPVGGGLDHRRLGHDIRDQRTTTGWQPTCDCSQADPPIPCLVLDPFAGAGTTGLVATQNGRDFVGIELSPDYAEMARKRIAHPGSVGRPKEEPAGQVPLFGGDG